MITCYDVSWRMDGSHPQNDVNRSFFSARRTTVIESMFLTSTGRLFHAQAAAAVNAACWWDDPQLRRLAAVIIKTNSHNHWSSHRRSHCDSVVDCWQIIPRHHQAAAWHLLTPTLGWRSTLQCCHRPLQVSPDHSAPSNTAFWTNTLHQAI